MAATWPKATGNNEVCSHKKVRSRIGVVSSVIIYDWRRSQSTPFFPTSPLSAHPTIFTFTTKIIYFFKIDHSALTVGFSSEWLHEQSPVTSVAVETGSADTLGASRA